MKKLATFRFHPSQGTVTDVAVGEDALQLLGTRLPRIAAGRWFVVSSAAVFDRHGSRLLDGAGKCSLDPSPLLVPDGEKAKSWSVLGRLLEELTARGLKRDGGVVAFGGGTVGDVGGLAAALVLRGVPVVQVPTTLLAASDSALGGKTAVDLPAGKNLAGAVHHPRLVLADTALLQTLPARALRSGLAEVVKSSFLDRAFHRAFDRLESGLAQGDPDALTEAVLRSLRMKARVVAADPLETTGARFALNLGHTVGHALETASRHTLTHGEAVGWGLLAILNLSVVRAGLDGAMERRLSDRVLRLVSPPRLTPRTLSGWVDRLSGDKKSDQRGLRAVLLHEPGRTVTLPVTGGELEGALEAALARRDISQLE
ncbi:MAG: 3-dehydroquinate synthase family protein [Thermoanaerobaculia bacterium]